MQTFLFPPDGGAVASASDVLVSEARAALERDIFTRDGLAALHRCMKRYFPAEYILVTYATDNPYDDLLLIHPQTGNAQNAMFNNTPEQLQALGYGPARVVRIGNQNDHGITLGAIQQIFPLRPFWTLVIRGIIAGKIIYSVSLVVPDQRSGRQAENPFTLKHVSMAFALFDELEAWFGQCTRKEHGSRMPVDDGLLPLDHLPGMRRVCELIWQVSRQDCPVLLLGETGTGKEVVARTLHRSSGRVGSPFIKVNCGALPESLIESELFGHEKGAFTGAIAERKGLFERANRGMLLLDELGELPLAAQTKLLRVLQEGVFGRVGGVEERNTDVRIIAATHRDLSRMVREGQFRADLYFRINVFPIVVPPLRERREDIPLLVRHFIRRKCSEFYLQEIPEPTPENMGQLVLHGWPGNVRELYNCVERAVILWIGDMRRPFKIVPDGGVLGQGMGVGAARYSEIPAQKNAVSSNSVTPGARGETAISVSRFETLDEAMARHIRKALELSGGKISGAGGAAELLGLHPNTLRAKMQKLEIHHIS